MQDKSKIPQEIEARIGINRNRRFCAEWFAE